MKNECDATGDHAGRRGEAPCTPPAEAVAGQWLHLLAFIAASLEQDEEDGEKATVDRDGHTPPKDAGSEAENGSRKAPRRLVTTWRSVAARWPREPHVPRDPRSAEAGRERKGGGRGSDSLADRSKEKCGQRKRLCPRFEKLACPVTRRRASRQERCNVARRHVRQEGGQRFLAPAHTEPATAERGNLMS